MARNDVRESFVGWSQRVKMTLHYTQRYLNFRLTRTGNLLLMQWVHRPYIEGSVGIENIFKLVRVDLVRRFDYLEHPNTPKWGIRARVVFTF